MVPVLFLAIALAVVVAIAFVAIGRLGELPEADVDIAEPFLPEGAVTPEGLAGTRFAVGLRGYRMSQVDDVLDRVIRDLADRDLRIAELESELAAQGAEEPVGALPTGSTENVTTERIEQPGGAGSEGESVKRAAEHSDPAPAGGTEGDNGAGPAPAGGTEGDNEPDPALAGGTEGDSGPAIDHSTSN